MSDLFILIYSYFIFIHFQWRNLFQTFLPFLMHGMLDRRYELLPSKKDPKQLSSQHVPNIDASKHRLLCSLLSRVIDLLCVRVLLYPALLEAEQLLHDYNKLFVDCFPKSQCCLNQHCSNNHLIGKTVDLLYIYYFLYIFIYCFYLYYCFYL